MSLLDAAGRMFSGGGGPGLDVVPLDPGTNKLIGDSVARSGRSDAAIGAEKNTGVQDAGGQGMQSAGDLKAQAAGTGQDSGMLDAIRKQYNNVAGSQINKIVQNNQMTAGLTRAHALQQSAHAALAQQQVETQNYEALSNALNSAEMARAQVLSNVLGTAGMGAGMYLGSRRPKTEAETINQFNGQKFNTTNYDGRGPGDASGIG
jgi:hypothetical protein